MWDWNIETGCLEFRDDLPGRSRQEPRHGVITGEGLGCLLDMVHPDDRQGMRHTLMSGIGGSERLVVQHYRLRRPDGTYAEVRDRQCFLRNPEGKAEVLTGSIIDLSDPRQSDTRSPQSERLELLGEMTGGIAHNFNNLLTVILGNVDRLRGENMDSGTILNAVRMIDEAAQRGAALTERLMSFAQARALRLKPVDLHQMIDSVAPVWRNLLPPEIHLSVRHKPGLWPVSTDAVHLEAAILNMVINARDAMPDGGALTIETQNVEAGSDLVRTAPGETPARYVMVKVTDTGIGMPPEDVKAAFDPFFTTKPPGKGTGLGLSSAYAFFKQSGGFVRLQSTPGQGTTLRVLLRVADDCPVPDVRPTVHPDRSGRGQRVLVVDDDPLMRDYVRSLLTSLDYKVTTAVGGADALVLLASGQRIDLLLTDILMEGGINGWDLAQRAQDLRPDLPVLFTSAHPDSAAAPQGLSAVRTVLRKPYRPRDLSLAVQQALAPVEGRT